MRQSRGYSLVEVMVATFVGALLLTAALAMMLVGKTVLVRLSAQGDMETARQIALEPLVRDLRQTVLSTVTIIQAPPAIALRPEDPGSASAGSFVGLFQFNVYYFDTTGGNWVFTTWSGVAGDTVLPSNPLIVNRRLTPAELLQIVNNPRFKRVLATEITDVRFTPSTFPTNTPAATITIGMDRVHLINSNDRITATYQTSVTPRQAP